MVFAGILLSRWAIPHSYREGYGYQKRGGTASKKGGTYIRALKLNGYYFLILEISRIATLMSILCISALIKVDLQGTVIDSLLGLGCVSEILK